MRRILFEIPFPGGHYLPVRAFGVMAALGFLAALWVALDRGRREKLQENVIWDVWTASILGGLAGARLLFVVEHWDYYRDDLLQVFVIWGGGLTWYGGVGGAMLAALVYLRLRRQPILPVFDAVTPASVIGLAFGRVGCFLNGCCFGRVTDVVWGVCFPRFGGIAHMHNALAEQFSPPFAYQVEHLGLEPGLPTTFPVHPTQLYSLVNAVIIFLLLTIYYPRRKRPGEVFLLMVILYGGGRFFIEHFRTNAEVWMGMSLAQVMSIIAVPIALGFFIRSRRRLSRAAHVPAERMSSKARPKKRRGRGGP